MRQTIANILRWQAKKYISKNNLKIAVITGSVGKTSTTQAIATVLEMSFRVRKTLQNYNTDIGVPCSIFSKQIPSSIKNPASWTWLILNNQMQIYRKAPFEILVLELGTDNPGDIFKFSWLRPDIAVVTAVAPEHMEFFKTIDNVAKEELSVANYSDKTIINKNMVDSKYLKYVDNDQIFNYSRGDISLIGLETDELSIVGEHSIDAISAAIGVGRALGMQVSALIDGAKMIKPLKGRMNKLQGINNSILIDDTYNASPMAVTAALDYLYSVKAPQRIALLGNMNELGEYSEEAHRKLGRYCNPKKIDVIITLGPDVTNYTAIEARKKGCKVFSTNNPYEAAEIIKSVLIKDAVILFKGSQNGVYAEETTKLLLNNSEDEKYLVRQSAVWLKKKQVSFMGLQK